MNTLSQVGKAAIDQSEISSEISILDKAIQQTFDSSRNLMERLQPILKLYPAVPQDEQKSTEEAMSEIGSSLRRHRRAIDGINSTLTEIISRLAI